GPGGAGKFHLMEMRTRGGPVLHLLRSNEDAATPRAKGTEVRDPYVSKALALMRAEPATRFTVTSLARRVGLSRAAFARRFVESTGEPPLRRLTALRMERAAELLVESDECLAAIAARVGYESEF